MADGLFGGVGSYAGGSFTALLANHIGETVTIFTSSGGQSGSGFTGVILAVNACFVRLITRIGPPPGCALGNACSNFGVGYGSHGAGHGGYGAGPIAPANELGTLAAGGWNGYPVYTVGSVTDIPVDSIVSFVHNAV
ncbi:MAG: hypothetical protein N2645_04280 [Clostridia bacterium]|nr:hypothetical protein [Clostridia bacterium]